ncbi:hypothetical protein D3C85_1905630 [compost metagenome]
MVAVTTRAAEMKAAGPGNSMGPIPRIWALASAGAKRYPITNEIRKQSSRVHSGSSFATMK